MNFWPKHEQLLHQSLLSGHKTTKLIVLPATIAERASGGKSSGKDGTLKTEILLSELPFAWLSRLTQLWQVARSPWGDAFSIIPPCTMKYVVKATCRIKRHSKTKASQILWLIIPQSACRVDLPGSQILNLCNSCVSAIFIYFFPLEYVIHYIWNAGLQKHNKYVWWWWWSCCFFFFFGSNKLSKSWVLQRSHGLSSVESPFEMNHHLCRTTSCEVVGNTLGSFFIYLFWFLGIITGM